MNGERETERFSTGGGRGISLRFSGFYAPYAQSTLDSVSMARRRLLPVAGDGSNYFSSIHVDDAATAAVAALDAARRRLQRDGRRAAPHARLRAGHHRRFRPQAAAARAEVAVPAGGRRPGQVHPQLAARLERALQEDDRLGAEVPERAGRISADRSGIA